MFLIGKSLQGLQGSGLYCVIFMLCKCFPAGMKRIWEENADIKFWVNALTKQVGLPVDSAIKTESISKDMPSYSHGKEQLYHNSET